MVKMLQIHHRYQECRIRNENFIWNDMELNSHHREMKLSRNLNKQLKNIYQKIMNIGIKEKTRPPKLVLNDMELNIHHNQKK